MLKTIFYLQMMVDLRLVWFSTENIAMSLLITQSFNLLSMIKLTWSQAVSMIHSIVHLNVMAAGISDSVAACHTVEDASRLA